MHVDDTYWLKQTDKPLFENVLWSRPENKRGAGKLLIVGGHAQSFSTVSQAYAAAMTAGVGTIRLLLPDSLQKSVSRLLPEAEYGPSTPSGSFSAQALAPLIDLAAWSDGVLLAGDFGRNAEVSVLYEKFAAKYSGSLCLGGDALDLVSAGDAAARPATVIVSGVAKLQKLAAHSGHALKQTATLRELVRGLHEWTIESDAAIVTTHAGQTLVAHRGRVSSTPGEGLSPGYASVWQIQQPANLFESLSSAAYAYLQEDKSNPVM